MHGTCRDTGMRNERELFRMRIENLNWENRVIFVPDTKTPEGRRLVPMSRRVFDILKKRCGTRTDSWVFPSKRSASGHLSSICNLFRQARSGARFPQVGKGQWSFLQDYVWFEEARSEEEWSSSHYLNHPPLLRLDCQPFSRSCAVLLL